MKAIEIKNLTKRYGNFTAVNNISFDVEAGSMIGFLGVNGAGKSTTINMLSTILTPDGGEVNVCGYRLGKQDMEIRKSIGVVYQSNVLDNLLTVKENLVLRATIAGLSKEKINKRLSELSDLLKLESILNKKYQLLSGGQKRRCEIALALMHSPKILFLDEPTTGLDPATRIDVWEAVKLLRKNEDMTVFLTTHYMEEAATADKIVIIDKGEILAEGTPFELKETYAKDRLKLYFSKEKEENIKNFFKEDTYKTTKYGARVYLNSSIEAIKEVEKVKDLIDGFEVIQGNMDDVFLNVTKKDEETA
ncbi:MAG: ABC transporter ATP-binding protein [Lachnospiraceae bacterium]|nr:ABC transporter ATP-binding protein [Lachnospiraceae bacterium]